MVFGGGGSLAGDVKVALRGEVESDGAGISVSGAGDVNGDGYADLLISAQLADPNGSSSGKCYVVYGREELDTSSLAAIAEGDGGFALEGEAANEDAGRSVSGAGDVNGDGYADLLIGASGAESDAGRVYVVYGGDFTLTTAFPGTPDDDTFVGSPVVESIVGGLGNDTLESGGGRDTLYGGAGDDTLILPGTDFFRIDGGYGQDTLKVDGFLDLTEIPNLAIKSIETIDITGSGNNSITLDRLDAFALTETRTLTIDGDAGDAVFLDLTDTDFVRTDEGAYALLVSGASRFTLRLNRALDLSQVRLGSG